MEINSSVPQKIKKETILIEVVDNGFIVQENFSVFRDLGRIQPDISSRKVFNTKKQLFNYISQNL